MRVKSYNISQENADWLSSQGKIQERSASWYLNDLLTKMRNKSKPKKQVAVIDESQVIIRLPLKSGTHPVMNDDVLQYIQTYRNIDLEQELKSMYAWLESNPAKRKTATGMKRFINSWLQRANDRGGSGVYQGDY